MTEPTDAKWGQPAHSGEPSYLDRLIDRLEMPPQSMTASDLRALHTEAAFMLRMQRSAQDAPPQPARAVLAKFGTPPAMAGQLADEQIEDLLECGNPTDDEKRLVRMGWDAARNAPPAQAQAGAVPLTKVELFKRAKVGPIHTERGDKVVLYLATYRNELENRFTTGWREAERYHGIKGGQHAE